MIIKYFIMIYFIICLSCTGDIVYFNKVYKKHTNFSFEKIRNVNDSPFGKESIDLLIY